jgi:hypothetical protein
MRGYMNVRFIECCTREIMDVYSESPTENMNTVEFHLSGRWLCGWAQSFG